MSAKPYNISYVLAVKDEADVKLAIVDRADYRGEYSEPGAARDDAETEDTVELSDLYGASTPLNAEQVEHRGSKSAVGPSGSGSGLVTNDGLSALDRARAILQRGLLEPASSAAIEREAIRIAARASEIEANRKALHLGERK